MRRYLVVANQTLGSQHLRDRMQAAMAEGPCHFHLVVPASHPSGAWSEGEARALAARRLDRALFAFRAMGADVSGEVGDASPIRAISDVLLEEQFDEILLSTLPPGPSRWLRQDVVHRVQRTFAIPCSHVVAEAEPAGMPG
jgi:GABA permease